MRKISWEERKAVMEKAFADEGKGYKLIGLVGEFKGSTSRIAYECPDHGQVEGRLGDMIKGHRCLKCAGRAKIDWPERRKMIEADLAKHGNKYTVDPDYGSEYVGKNSKIRLSCGHHGQFLMTPGDITRGRGCPTCGKESTGNAFRTDESDVIKRIKDADSRYTFIGFEGGVYVNSNGRAIRSCEAHGEFRTCISHIIYRQIGCPSCAVNGYDNNKTGFLYGLLSTCGKYLKIGITNKLEQRLRQLKSATPFEFYVLNVYKDENGTRCRMLESYFHRAHTAADLHNFNGATEWMAADTAIIAEFTKLCNEGHKPRGWRK